MGTVQITWEGNLREIATHFGRFRRGIARDVRVEDATRLMAAYPGFRVKGIKQGGHLEALARTGQHIAVIRNRGFGDVIACAYFLAYPLAYAHPKTKVDFYSDLLYTPIVEQFPFLNQVFGDVKSNFSRYDGTVDLCWVPEREDRRNEKVRTEIFGRYAGSLANYKYDFLEFPSELKMKGQAILEKGGRDSNRSLVGIQTTSASPVRVYPFDYLGDLIQGLVNEGFEVALFGQDHWNYKLNQWNGDHLLNFIDRTTLLECACAMELCDYFIAPDSGLLHLASIFGIPTLALFGNIKPENRIKYYPNTVALYPEFELDCIPCGDVHNPCPECSNLSGSYRSGRCMYLLTPERVLRTFLDFIEGKGKYVRRIARITNIHCPFCNSPGKIENSIQGKWFSEIYEKRVDFYRCLSCSSIYSDPRMLTVDYEEEYFSGGAGKFSGDYFTPGKQEYHKRMASEVLSIYKSH